jgi:hypothetical protein
MCGIWSATGNTATLGPGPSLGLGQLMHSIQMFHFDPWKDKKNGSSSWSEKLIMGFFIWLISSLTE